MRRLANFLTVILACGAISSLAASPASAHGGGRGGGGWHGGGGWGGWGVGIGFAPGYPYYYPPPVYYPPAPAYYPSSPPPGYYSPYPGYIQQSPAPATQPAPVQSSDASAAQSCNAGSYVCPMEVTVPVGNRCYCPDNNGSRAYGTAQ